ncbi:conserved Plasmodium protein, unknown function [Plasmodium vivax]|uniref:Uncharacterized protein n=1 Tax=Plasmodium vivax TaxID=5855 RepID=A0A1G4GXY6_PLAVI|nr:conserved Plasmodium protein, unknown function [Plasmodium vivax]
MKCFLCDSEVLPTLNTFIVLDTVIQMLKGSEGGRSKAKGGEKKKKKALYLTNRILMEAFPPNFNFILEFLNGQVNPHPGGEATQEGELCEVGEAAQPDEPDEPDEPHQGRNSFQQNTHWSIHTVKDVRRGTVERVTQFEPPMKEHLSLDRFKEVLKDIHVKYIEQGGDCGCGDGEVSEERSLTEALYHLNEQNEYYWVIVNLAFLFVKDKKKINLYAENLSLHYADGKTKQTCADSLKNTKEILFSPRSKNQFGRMLMERELYDVPFFKNILSLHFCYSFLVNFEEHVNYHRGAYKSVQRGAGRARFDDKGGGQLTGGGRSTYRAERADRADRNDRPSRACDGAHDRNDEPTGGSPTRDQPVDSTRTNRNPLEGHSVGRKRKVGEIEKGDCRSYADYGGHSSVSLRDGEGSTTDAPASDGSDGERHAHAGHLRNLSDVSGVLKDPPRREHRPTIGSTHAEDLLTPRKRKKKKGNKKKHLCTFDVAPKSDLYKKIYLNMMSLYCDCICLIS